MDRDKDKDHMARATYDKDQGTEGNLPSPTARDALRVVGRSQFLHRESLVHCGAS